MPAHHGGGLSGGDSQRGLPGECGTQEWAADESMEEGWRVSKWSGERTSEPGE